MYQECSRPGRKPRQHRARLMKESALQRPRLTHTVGGGRWLVVVSSWERRGWRGLLTGDGREEDGDYAEEDVGAAHFVAFVFLLRCSGVMQKIAILRVSKVIHEVGVVP